jgi:cytochrome c553
LRVRLIVGAAVALIALAPARGPARGRSVAEQAAICSGCHGEDGVPQEKTTPVIWGQTEGYLYFQLRDYKSGVRKNDIMTPLAQALERGDMLALAQYFTDKPWPNLRQPSAPKEVAARALAANVSVGCTGCHLDQWQGAGTVPRLAGLSREYLAKTIAEFRTRARANNPGMSDLMIVTPEQDLAALAEYLAGL